MTIKAALKWVQATHSHLDEPEGALFAVGVAEDGRLCCVAVAGNPNARMLQGKALYLGTRHFRSASHARGSRSRPVVPVTRRHLSHSTRPIGRKGTKRATRTRKKGWLHEHVR